MLLWWYCLYTVIYAGAMYAFSFWHILFSDINQKFVVIFVTSVYIWLNIFLNGIAIAVSWCITDMLYFLFECSALLRRRTTLSNLERDIGLGQQIGISLLSYKEIFVFNVIFLKQLWNWFSCILLDDFQARAIYSPMDWCLVWPACHPWDPQHLDLVLVSGQFPLTLLLIVKKKKKKRKVVK